MGPASMGFGSGVEVRAFIMKFVEFVMVFIVFLLFRCGDSGNMFHWGTGPQYNGATTPTTNMTTTTTTTTTTTNMNTTPDPTTDPTTDTPEGFAEDKLSKFAAMESYPRPRLSPDFTYSERAENDLVFGTMTSTGYLLFIIIIMLGMMMGDKMPFTLILFNFFGFLFYIAMGSEQIDAYHGAQQGKSMARGMGAMSILTSFVFLVDTVFTVLDLRSSEQ